MRTYREVAGDAGSDITAQLGRMRDRLDDRLARVGAVVVFASPKGGVGKSTVAAHVAASLARREARVGMLDADLYGSSLPALLTGPASSGAGAQGLEPVIGPHGIKVMSVDYLTGHGDAACLRWSGAPSPALTGAADASAVREMLADTAWGDLDFLIVDTPPVTGKAGDLIAMVGRPAGVVMVTLPSALSYQVVLKSLQVFRETGARILGVVENMTAVACRDCGAETSLHGQGCVEETLALVGVPYLGGLPFHEGAFGPLSGETPIPAAWRERVDQVTNRIVARLDMRGTP